MEFGFNILFIFGLFLFNSFAYSETWKTIAEIRDDGQNIYESKYKEGCKYRILKYDLLSNTVYENKLNYGAPGSPYLGQLSRSGFTIYTSHEIYPSAYIASLVSIVSIKISNNNDFLYPFKVFGPFGFINVYDPATGELLYTVGGPTWVQELSPDNEFMLGVKYLFQRTAVCSTVAVEVKKT